MTRSAYLGIDVGTGGVRCALQALDGTCVASASEPLRDAEVLGLPPGRHEQRPEAWWPPLAACIRKIVAAAGADSIAALSVDSTSGTVVFLDGGGRPLRPAIMYNDTRAAEQAARINAAAADFTARHGSRFGSSFALAKVLWVKEHEPDAFERAAMICHAADYLAGRLRGSFGVTDTSNALKMGCDLFDASWPGFIEGLGVPLRKLPRLVAPGTPTGGVCRSAAAETGLRPDTAVVAGCTDGTAGFLASGAAGEGDWASTLGTTLVLRGISRDVVKDPAGRVYCHRHPDGWWLPGSAASVGGECLAHHFPGRDLAGLDRQAMELGHTDALCYPLVRRGERFPFVNPAAEGFTVCEAAGGPLEGAELHLACLEGVAFVERWGLELFAGLGASTAGRIFATGGGAKSTFWLQVRATVLGRELCVPAQAGSEVGAAALAAAADCGSVSEACRRMVRLAGVVRPDASRTALYDAKYRRFRELCTARGYV